MPSLTSDYIPQDILICPVLHFLKLCVPQDEPRFVTHFLKHHSVNCCVWHTIACAIIFYYVLEPLTFVYLG